MKKSRRRFGLRLVTAAALAIAAALATAAAAGAVQGGDPISGPIFEDPFGSSIQSPLENYPDPV